MRPVRTLADFIAGRSLPASARAGLRDGALRVLSLTRSWARQPGTLRFVFYHHVFDDERAGFARQLAALRRIGDFIAIDDAVTMIESGRIEGSHVCVTFDDGYRNNLLNAAPILVDAKAPAAFFLATRFIAAEVERDRQLLLSFFEEGDILLEFLSWEECRALAAAGMTLGSHGVSHVPLARLEESAAREEMKSSKETIERELGRPCVHFCAPFGKPGADFLPGRDPVLAREAGYRSFLTTRRGAAGQGGNAFSVPRDHLIAAWGDHQLRYFLGS